MNATRQEQTEAEQPFPQAAALVLDKLSRALAAALDECREVVGNRPIDIARGLGVDMKLAWKASHVANTSSSFEAVRHIPGAAGLRILVDAMVARGVSRPTLDHLQEAFEAVRNFISRTAGSRRAFESMVAGIDDSRDRRLESEHRRLLFDGASSVWGLRAEALQRMDVLFPSSTPGLLDCVTIRGLCQIRRVRGGVSLPLSRPRVIDDHGTQVRSVLEEPLVGADGPHGLPLVEELCRGELPSIELRHIGDHSHHELRRSESADASPFTLVTGETLRSVQPTLVEGETHGLFQLMRLRVPAGRAVFDVLVHDDLVEERVEPDVYVSSDLHGPVEGVGDIRRVRLPLDLRCRAVPIAELPRDEVLFDVAEASRLATTVAGHSLDRFRWFRLELAFPPISSTIAFECEQPAV